MLVKFSSQDKIKSNSLPVFPDVGSMIVDPGLRIPLASASRTILYPILSLTLPPGFKNSHLASKIKKIHELRFI